MGAPAASALVSLEENLWSMWSQFGRGPGCRLEEMNGVVYFETPLLVPPYNMVIRAHCDSGPEAESAVDAIAERFRRRGVPLLWFVHPSARPSDLKTRLAARGCVEVEPVTGMVADLATLSSPAKPPAGIDVRQVTREDEPGFLEFVATRWQVPAAARADLGAIAATFRIGHRDSPNRAWIAIEDDRAVAKVFTHDGDGHVGIYGMATRPETRGRGLGKLLCLTALADARRRGFTRAVLHSTPAAVSLYQSVGFRPVAAFSLHAPPGAFYA
jgi:ribosomal protein S18 acetylase RimI-like enzyme